VIGLALVGCAVTPPDDPGYLRLAGSVAPDVTLDGDDAGAVLVWATVASGETCVEVDPLRFVPHLLSYEAEVDGPPALDGDPCVPTPAAFGDPGPFAAGLLVLVDPDQGQPLSVRADPVSLLDWFATGAGSPGALLTAERGRVAAVAGGYTLMVARDGLAVGPEYCRLDDVVPGLVLYDDRGVDCGGWAPLAEPGERTEYQGVDLEAP
jgi:hypothetical protein